MGGYDEVNPEVSNLNNFREYQFRKMEHWYANGEFFYTPVVKDGAPLSLIGKSSSDIETQHILTAMPKIPKALITVKYISKKKEQHFLFFSESWPVLNQLEMAQAAQVVQILVDCQRLVRGQAATKDALHTCR